MSTTSIDLTSSDLPTQVPSRRRLKAVVAAPLIAALLIANSAIAAPVDPEVAKAVTRGLDYLAREQRRQGYWEANLGQYRVAMTALAGIAFLSEGSTTTRGKYAQNVSRALDFLLDTAQPNGLIGYSDDYHYTYGHGFSMLFLSQVYGEEENADRRQQIKAILERAVRFSAEAQTSQGGWGYVSARDGSDFDEGSTCVTQVQGLRACRNAGIVVPKEIIDRAKGYISKCLTEDGGVQYSIRGGGARAPITAAAVASMFSAGEYAGSQDVEKMLRFCQENIWPRSSGNLESSFGHWHYMHYYFSQVMYRDEAKWNDYLKDVTRIILSAQQADGSWQDGTIGAVYVTAINTTILQLEKAYLPIYQR